MSLVAEKPLHQPVSSQAKGLSSCIYTGWVRHRRFSPVPHSFRYGLYMMYLDLDELPGLFAGTRLWSSSRPALSWFDRRDHLGDPSLPLDTCVRDHIEAETGRRPQGPIRLLTHLRTFGYRFNPVSFYYAFEEDGRTVEAVVAEINNTPWGEQHAYVVPAERLEGHAFDKVFHVSPFMGMDQTYVWTLSKPAKHLTVHMQNLEGGSRVFDATMSLAREDLTLANLRRVLWRYPFITARVVAGIYWQALKLRVKKCPVYPHPNS